MKFFNKVTEEEIELNEGQIKEIIEAILFTSSNGCSWFFMNGLSSTNQDYYIVSQNWMEKSKESKFSFELLEIELKSKNKQLEKIKSIL